ncbi:myb-like protein X isoform X2 [Haliotis rufescens]|uniref:myb-like protein X isoform X2 n=1 Tax=Haliotis rufescens TaxID=6454 RepID=UPI00201F901D|nr:myb-like protein X isoform X2 [Haliotis rufescens]
MAGSLFLPCCLWTAKDEDGDVYTKTPPPPSEQIHSSEATGDKGGDKGADKGGGSASHDTKPEPASRTTCDVGGGKNTAAPEAEVAALREEKDPDDDEHLDSEMEQESVRHSGGDGIGTREELPDTVMTQEFDQHGEVPLSEKEPQITRATLEPDQDEHEDELNERESHAYRTTRELDQFEESKDPSMDRNSPDTWTSQECNQDEDRSREREPLITGTRECDKHVPSCERHHSAATSGFDQHGPVDDTVSNRDQRDIGAVVEFDQHCSLIDQEPEGTGTTPQDNETTLQENETTSRENETTSRENETTSQENENTWQENENTSQENENTSQENENTSQENENTWQENENTSQENENTWQENENTRQVNENTSRENETIPPKNEITPQEIKTTLQGNENTPRDNETISTEETTSDENETTPRGTDTTQELGQHAEGEDPSKVGKPQGAEITPELCQHGEDGDLLSDREIPNTSPGQECEKQVTAEDAGEEKGPPDSETTGEADGHSEIEDQLQEKKRQEYIEQVLSDLLHAADDDDVDVDVSETLETPDRATQQPSPDKRLDTALHDACRLGDLQQVKDTLSDGLMDINCRGRGGQTPAMAAARQGHNKVLLLLVDEGADLSLTADDGNNSLHHACRVGHVEIVKTVLAKNTVDINSRGQGGRTALLWAAGWGRGAIFEMLLQAGADLSAVKDGGNNILHVACHGGDLAIVKYVLSQDVVHITDRNSDWETAPMIAKRRGHTSVWKLLMSSGRPTK